MCVDRVDAANLRADRRETVHRVALALLERTDATRTTRPTWAHLMARTGKSRATVARALAQLRSWGLLGVVASGRQGIYAPRGSNTDGRAPVNEAAVYVLCEIPPVQLVPDLAPPVDENETPPREGLDLVPRTRAELTFVENPAEPLRGQPDQAAQARPTHPGADRQRHWFPSTATPSGKDDMLLAARELQARLPVLRRISPEHVRSVLREFFLAGWSVADVILTIDRLPNENRWAHDGATGVANVGAWLAHRMRPWRQPGGTVRPSPSHRAAAEHALNRARHRAAAEAHTRDTAAATTPRTSPVAADAMRRIRATLTHARRR
jgi:hypothetical protein